MLNCTEPGLWPDDLLNEIDEPFLDKLIEHAAVCAYHEMLLDRNEETFLEQFRFTKELLLADLCVSELNDLTDESTTQTKTTQTIRSSTELQTESYVAYQRWIRQRCLLEILELRWGAQNISVVDLTQGGEWSLRLAKEASVVQLWTFCREHRDHVLLAAFPLSGLSRETMSTLSFPNNQRLCLTVVVEETGDYKLTLCCIGSMIPFKSPSFRRAGLIEFGGELGSWSMSPFSGIHRSFLVPFQRESTSIKKLFKIDEENAKYLPILSASEVTKSFWASPQTLKSIDTISECPVNESQVGEEKQKSVTFYRVRSRQHYYRSKNNCPTTDHYRSNQLYLVGAGTVGTMLDMVLRHSISTQFDGRWHASRDSSLAVGRGVDLMSRCEEPMTCSSCVYLARCGQSVSNYFVQDLLGEHRLTVGSILGLHLYALWEGIYGEMFEHSSRLSAFLRAPRRWGEFVHDWTFDEQRVVANINRFAFAACNHLTVRVNEGTGEAKEVATERESSNGMIHANSPFSCASYDSFGIFPLKFLSETKTLI